MAAGWLSNLLAVTSADLGDHATALVWCADAERRSVQSGHGELAGWAMLTRAMIAYYHGQGQRAVEFTGRGMRVAAMGTIAHAKLAAQQMRAWAMLGNAQAMIAAKRHATTAIARLPADVATTGVFSIALAEDPPYTATSLLLAGRYREAVTATRRVIDISHPDSTRGRGGLASNHARALQILALAHAGLGHVAEAAQAGHTALRDTRLAWPTMVLAGKLDQVLAGHFPGSIDVADYHAHYLAAASEMRASPTNPRTGHG